LLALIAVPTLQAATFTYSGITGSNDWSTGTDWDATPVSDVTTEIIYTGTIAGGDTVDSNNDVSDPFLLNRMEINYEGGNTATVNITGGDLEFNNSGSNAVLSIRPSSGPVVNFDTNLTLTDQLNLTADHTTVNFDGVIGGSGLLNLIGGNGDNATFTLMNTGNDWTGGLRISTNGTVGGTRAVVLGASDVIPNGAGAGDVFVVSDGEGTHSSLLRLNGFNETINGVQAVYEDNMRNKDQNQSIENNGDTNSVLTIGDNDADSNFLGLIQDGGGLGNLGITKIGTGNLTLAARSLHTGDTTVNGGTLTIDFTQFEKSSTPNSDPSDYFSASSNLILNGGTTLAIVGREDGGTVVNDSIGTQQYGNYITVSSQAIADEIVVGQELVVTRPDTSVNNYTVNGKNGTDIYVTVRTGGGAATLNTTATDATTTQNIQNISFTGGVGENATIDFGTSDNVLLMVNSSPVQLNDGSTVTLANWSGSFSGGGDDQWVFMGEPGDFSGVFTQSEVIFDGFGAGYNLIDGTGIYEVVPVPEPSTYALLIACGALVIAIRRRQR